MAERLARVEPILALVVRDLGWPPEHPAAPDLDLLLSQPPGVIALSPSADVRIWIVLDGCPPDVREATRRKLETKITILYSVRTTNDIIFNDEFHKLEQIGRASCRERV